MQALKKELKGFWVASINFTRHPTNRKSWDFMRFLSYAGVRGACGLALLLVQYYLVVGGFYVKLLFYNLGIPKGSLSKDEIYPRWPHLIVRDGVFWFFSRLDRDWPQMTQTRLNWPFNWPLNWTSKLRPITKSKCTWKWVIFKWPQMTRDHSVLQWISKTVIQMMKFLMKRSFIHEEILQRGRRKYLALPELPSRRFSFYHKALTIEDLPMGAIDSAFPKRKVGRPEIERSHDMKMNGIDRNGTVVWMLSQHYERSICLKSRPGSLSGGQTAKQAQTRSSGLLWTWERKEITLFSNQVGQVRCDREN